jgi:hypothetical protein
MAVATRIDGADFSRKAGACNVALMAVMTALYFALPATCVPDTCTSGQFSLSFAAKAVVLLLYLGAIALVILPRLQDARLTRAAVVPVSVALLSGMLFMAALSNAVPVSAGFGVGRDIPPAFIAGLASLVALSVFTPGSISDERNGKVPPAAMGLVIILALAAIGALFLGVGAVLSPPLVAWTKGHTLLLSAHNVVLYAAPLILAALVSSDLRKIYRHGDSTIWLWLGGMVGLFAMLIALYLTVLHLIWLGARASDLNWPPLIAGHNRSALQLAEMLSLLVLPLFLARVTYGSGANETLHSSINMTAPWRARLDAGSKGFGRRTA